MAISPQRVYRVWRAAGLQVPKKRYRRRVAASRPRPLPSTGPNHVWAYDLVHDACANGQKIKCLTIIDEWTRESLAIDVASSIRSPRIIDVLARLISVHGAPKYIRLDNGPEFISMAILRWLRAERIETATSLWASRGRTAPTRASTAAFEASAWAWSGSRLGRRRSRSSRAGDATTTRYGPTALART